MSKMLVTIAFAAIFASSQASAQEGGGGWAQQDMTRQQAQQMADSLFQRFDLNHDGMVTRQEAEQARQKMGFGGEGAGRLLDRTFGAAQSLTLQQFEAQSLVHFDKQDLNHDGVVTSAERQQARAQRQAAKNGDQNGGQ